MRWLMNKIVDRWLVKVLAPVDIERAKNAYTLNAILSNIDRDYFLCLDLALRNDPSATKTVVYRYFESITSAVELVCKIEADEDTSQEQVSEEASAISMKTRAARINIDNITAGDFIDVHGLKNILKKLKEEIEFFVNRNKASRPRGAFCLALDALEQRIVKTFLTLLALCVYISAVMFFSYKLCFLPALFEFDTIRRSNYAYNIFDSAKQNSFSTTGLDPAEIADSGIKFRWSDGERSEIIFYTARSNCYVLDFALSTLINEHKVKLIINDGEVIKNYKFSPAKKFPESSQEEKITFRTQPGFNIITFIYSDYNHFRTTFVPQDGRLLGCAFTRLLVFPCEGQ